MDDWPEDRMKTAGEVAERALTLIGPGEEDKLVVLLWALGLVEMPDAERRCDPRPLWRLMPPLSSESEEAFIAGAQLRPEEELTAERERIWTLHWRARDGGRHYKGPRELVDMGVIENRHFAINWITGPEDWDEVTTDT